MILNDSSIRVLCLVDNSASAIELLCSKGWTEPMIDPFSESVSGGGIVSWGLTSAGYDLRLDKDVLVFKNSYGEVVDPKRFKDESYQNRVFDRVTAYPDGSIVIPAHGYILGMSMEYLRIPRWLKGRCVGKSTLARSGIIINTTPLEPGWHGRLTIEVANSNPCPAKVFAGEGICQLEFEELSDEPDIDYEDKKGIYQTQTQVTPSRVRS